MTTIYSPSEKGFDERLTIVDRCQVALLREVLGQYGAGRLILKGGMAMRAAFGSMRLTKDIDFDRDPSLPISTLKGSLPKLLARSAANAGLRSPEASITKATDTTVRARVEGRTPTGSDARFEIEISGRVGSSKEQRRNELVVPPPSYRMAPFLVETYTNDMLTAMKIAASMSAMRSAPRDVYDLKDLIYAGANPVEILKKQDPVLLREVQEGALTKLELIGFELATQELFPYIPLSERESIDKDRWTDFIVLAADSIEQWCNMALEDEHRHGRPEERSQRPS